MTEIIQILKTALDGLAPVGKNALLYEVFFHVNPVATDLQLSELLTWTGHDPYTPVTTQDFSEFCRQYRNEAAPTLSPEHLPGLQTVLEQNLTNLQVYHIGSNPEQTYIIGEDEEGNFAGLKLLS
jgi:hypothetical protein